MCVIETLNIVSDVISIVGGIRKVQVQHAVGKYNVQQSINQAKIAEKNAAYERQEGIDNARKEKLKLIQVIGNIKSSTAAGNILTGSDMTLNMINGEKELSDFNALDIINKSERRAENYLDKANMYYNNASLISLKTKHNFANGLLSIFSNNLYDSVDSFNSIEGGLNNAKKKK